MTAIYVITNFWADRDYIGLTGNVAKRLRQHALRLQSGRHENLKLQLDYSEYGIDSFYYAVIVDFAHHPEVYRPHDVEHRFIATISRTRSVYNTTSNKGKILKVFDEAFNRCMESYRTATYRKLAKFVSDAE